MSHHDAVGSFVADPATAEIFRRGRTAQCRIAVDASCLRTTWSVSHPSYRHPRDLPRPTES